MVGEFADEADRVGDDGLARHLVRDALGLGVERGEELVDRHRVAPGQAVEQGRLAGVRVADQRDRERGLARLALRVALLLDLFELFLEARDAGADDALVELELRFTDAAPCTTARAAAAAAAGLPLEMGPGPLEARELILEQRQLDLRTRFARLGAGGEDVQDQAAAVDDPRLRPHELLEVAHLRGREVVVEHDQLRLVLSRQGLDLLGFPLADVHRGIGGAALAEQGGAHVRAGAFDQLGELFEVLLGDGFGDFREDEADGDDVFH
jgi:hypothetical protein